MILLNDTTAALLAGAANATEGRNYSSYVGVILGTGMNAAYIEGSPVSKTGAEGALHPEQIIVCESGKFNKIQRSNFDTEFDKTTNTPGLYIYEKMCSGAYLGHIIHLALKKAVEDNLFSPDVGKGLITLGTLELKDVDMFLYGPYRTDTLLGGIAARGTQSDYDILYMILDSFIERAARFTAANIASVVIRCGKGTNAALPVCVMCEGTTFIKTHNLQDRVKGYLNQVLTEERGLYFEIVSMNNAITLGAAIAGLTE
jgi:hexokinase